MQNSCACCCTTHSALPKKFDNQQTLTTAKLTLRLMYLTRAYVLRPMQAHLQQCQFAIVQCPNKECGEQMYRSDSDLHSKNCRHLPVACQWCRKEIPRLDQNVSLSLSLSLSLHSCSIIVCTVMTNTNNREGGTYNRKKGGLNLL